MLCITMAELEKNLKMSYGRLLPPIGLKGPGWSSGSTMVTFFWDFSFTKNVLTNLEFPSSAILSISSDLFSVHAFRKACNILKALAKLGLPILFYYYCP